MNFKIDDEIAWEGNVKNGNSFSIYTIHDIVDDGEGEVILWLKNEDIWPVSKETIKDYRTIEYLKEHYPERFI